MLAKWAKTPLFFQTELICKGFSERRLGDETWREKGTSWLVNIAFFPLVVMVNIPFFSLVVIIFILTKDFLVGYLSPRYLITIILIKKKTDIDIFGLFETSSDLKIRSFKKIIIGCIIFLGFLWQYARK